MGSWAVDRTLLDRASGTSGTFTGVVLFSPTGHDGGLNFHEHGTVRWTAFDGAPFSGPATRDYVLRPTGAPDAMDVYFPDGRPFHRMSFSDHAVQDQHWCDPDTYTVRYTMRGPDSFSYSWDVSGPAKDLLLDSTLKRLDAAPANPPAGPTAAGPTG
ncbi:DUF6314 family protein [Arthrobacter sp. 92]|uniref:DUF6314 family protein n=1 Tax=Arthrobacter sp. 92 TaxID=3418175 RepID=UPI003D02556E